MLSGMPQETLSVSVSIWTMMHSMTLANMKGALGHRLRPR
jgi:hypothetical protein